MWNERLVKWAGLILLPAALLAASGAAAGDSGQPEAVVYRLKWLFNVSVVGDLYAKEKGLFAEKGLAVEVKPGGPERDAIKELELGRAQFGVASADQVIRARAKGSPIVVLAQLFQTNPLHWIYRPEATPFKTPADLRGRTVGVTFGGNDETIMRALLAKHGIAENELKLFSVRYDYTPFYQRRVDFWPLYLNAQAPIIGARLAAAGERYAFLNPADFGVRFVANSLVTTERMLAERPDTVRRFTTALLEGWRRALDPANEQAAIEVLLRNDPETPEDIVRRQLPVTRRLMLPPQGAPFGRIDAEAWRQTEEIMRTQGLIAAPVDVQRLLKPVK